VRPLKTVRVTRYVTPLREGGSLPAIVEADDDGMYVLKFRGAGQGPRALVAELISCELGRALGLPVPDLVFAELDPDLSRTEPDPEIHALIYDSGGLNLAIDYLPGSVMFDPIAHKPTAEVASQIVWFDAFVTNVDRTARNPNLLMWHRRLWLIDHGATLYFHHTAGWQADVTRAREPFALIRDHVMAHRATRLAQIDDAIAALVTPDLVEAIVAQIPDAWLAGDPGATAAESRAAYTRYLLARAAAPRAFIEEAARAR
jgi:HipA-like protein